MHESTLLIFAAVAFVGIATPGPTVLLALTNGSRYGLRRAAYGFAGAVASDFVLIFRRGAWPWRVAGGVGVLVCRRQMGGRGLPGVHRRQIADVQGFAERREHAWRPKP